VSRHSALELVVKFKGVKGKKDTWLPVKSKGELGGDPLKMGVTLVLFQEERSWGGKGKLKKRSKSAPHFVEGKRREQPVNGGKGYVLSIREEANLGETIGGGGD